jgi:hypothetical protein
MKRGLTLLHQCWAEKAAAYAVSAPQGLKQVFSLSPPRAPYPSGNKKEPGSAGGKRDEWGKKGR